MKKHLLIIILGLTSLFSLAQQRPHYTQYVLNNYILNPALTGIENYTDLKLSARDQWVGLDGAPQTFYLSIHAPLGKKDYRTTATSFEVPGANPRGTAYWENYTAAKAHHGIGFYMISDRTGLFNRFNANVSYAYHLGLSPKANIAAGFSAGISKLSYDWSKATPADPNDPAIIGNSSDNFQLVPDVNAGIWLYSDKYFAGLSVQQLVPQQISFTGSSEGFKLLPHYFATAGYRFLVSEEINAIPSVMIKYISPVESQFELNAKLQYLDLLWVGGSYRFQDGFAAMIGINTGNTFNIGYSYDFTMSNLNTASRGSHELMLGFLIGNRYGDTCPRNVW